MEFDLSQIASYLNKVLIGVTGAGVLRLIQFAFDLKKSKDKKEQDLFILLKESFKEEFEKDKEKINSLEIKVNNLVQRNEELETKLDIVKEELRKEQEIRRQAEEAVRVTKATMEKLIENYDRED